MERYYGKKPVITITPETIQTAKDLARLSTNGCFFGGSFWDNKNEFTIINSFLFNQTISYYNDPKLDMDDWRRIVDSRTDKDNDAESFAFMGFATKDYSSPKVITDKEIKVLENSIGLLYSKVIYLKANKNQEVSVGIVDFENKYLFEDIGYTIDTFDYGLSDAEVRAEIDKNVKFSSAYNNNDYSNNNSNNNSGYSNNKYTPPVVYKDVEINTKNPKLLDLTGDKLQFNIEGFKTICVARQENLRRYFAKRLEELYGKKRTTVTDDYIFCKGTLPVMLVSHMDTVHKEMPGKIFHDTNLDEVYSPDGIGGDDRCGIYGVISVLMSIKDGKYPSVMFTMNEETGCVGAKKAMLQVKNDILDINFLIELDRRGKDHAVYYDTTNQEFIKYISSFGFAEETGFGSDVKYLSKEWEVASANLAIGYYEEHTLKEYVRVKEMMNTIKKVKKIVDDSPNSKFFTRTTPTKIIALAK